MVSLRRSFPLLLLLTLMVSTLFLNLFDIGPFSPKNYLVTVLIILLIGSIVVNKQNLFVAKEAYNLFLIYSGFILWVFIDEIINGKSLNSVCYNLISNHISGIAIFIAIQYYLRSYRDIAIVAAFMGITVLLSVCVGIMQYYDVPLAWTLRSFLYPERQLLLALDITDIKDVGYVPGLSLYSINFTYHIATFGMILVAWTYFVFQKRDLLRLIVGMAAVSVLIVGLLLGQSRSAFFGVFLGLFLLIRYAKDDHADVFIRAKKKNAKKFVFFGLIIIIVALVFSHVKKNEQEFYSRQGTSGALERIVDIKDSQRIALTKVSIGFILENFLFGGSDKYFEYYRYSDVPGLYELPKAPHNLFLNAAVYYGIIGLLLIILLVKAVFSTCIKAVKLSNKSHSTTWITFGVVTGIVAEFSNSQFHNNNFVSGSDLPWWLLGILCVIIAREQKFSLNHKAKDFAEKALEKS